MSIPNGRMLTDEELQQFPALGSVDHVDQDAVGFQSVGLECEFSR
jgi:hypothetical protein